MANSKITDLKYIEIENYIINKIFDDTYKPNDMILSENQLAIKFNVSRMTARKAISNLISRNYLYQVMGKGTFVVNNDDRSPILLDKVIDFDERTISKGQTPSTRLKFFDFIAPNNLLKNIFKNYSFENIIKIERLRLINNQPAIYEITYLPDVLTNKLNKKELEILQLEYAKKVNFNGKKIKTQIREFSAILPEVKIQKELNICERSPVILLEVYSYFENGSIAEYSKVFYNQIKYKLQHKVNL